MPINPAREPTIYLGLMSGTSIDSIDVAAVDFEQGNNGDLHLLGCHTHSIPAPLRRDIMRLCEPELDTVQLYAETDSALGLLFAEAAATLMGILDLSSNSIVAIGSHGQTIRHAPPSYSKQGYSQQIGDPNIIAARTNCAVVADFRRKDIALGGQGAPLVPAFHQQLFFSPQKNRVIANIGGIANITVLNSNGDCGGFDTGPGNMLLDAWCQKHTGNAYDNNGNWGAGGTVDDALLRQLKAHPFLAQSTPKSTGREDFNLPWLELQLQQYNLSPQDIQATLALLTAETLADCINNLETQIDEVFVCGGGAFNGQLMALLQRSLYKSQVQSTAELGLDPNWVEACAFAWLAKQRMEHKTGNVPAVTGAHKATILGGLYLP
ncbi:MAG: anhydro-N-acetylmuramic acid kinase [Porticoccaceae bacterium]|nr:anhydro-N-acetylmuramic acid kinase [Porticoccaceae bacterium]